MGLFDRVGSLFAGGGGGMDKKAGEWAAKAMACMAFVDGGDLGQAELAAAQGQVKTNRVLRDSIGSKAAEAIFHETIESIRSLPAVMLQTHEAELVEVAQDITDITAKNFALATVIAVAMGDGTVTPAEQAMLFRFRAMLGATIGVPNVGQTMHAFEETVIQSGAVQPPSAADQTPINCPTCAKPTQFYEGHGHWCADCQQYAPVPAAEAAHRERQDTPEMPLPAVEE